MPDRRLFIILVFATIGAFVTVACLLIFLRVAGTASFDLFGQSFSSTNIGLAVLFVAAVILVFAIRDLKPADSPRRVLSSSASGEVITWQETIAGIDDLVLQLTASDGFRPDVVVGVCGGGLMVADLVAKRLGHIPCLSIWPDRHAHSQQSAFAGAALPVNDLALDRLLHSKSAERVLLVDDVAYSGHTLSQAIDFITSRSQEIQDGRVGLRTAVLYTLTSSTVKPDYAAYAGSKNRRMTPSSDRLRQLRG